MAQVIVDEGWAAHGKLDGVIDAVREWGEMPDAFAAWLYCGALRWVSSREPIIRTRWTRRSSAAPSAKQEVDEFTAIAKGWRYYSDGELLPYCPSALNRSSHQTHRRVG
jgi:hypothetical protein